MATPEQLADPFRVTELLLQMDFLGMLALRDGEIVDEVEGGIRRRSSYSPASPSVSLG